jgi:DNA polymerase-3 subunit alpha
VREELMKSITVKTRLEDLTTETVDGLNQIIKENQGKTELKIQISDPSEKLRVKMFSRSVRVKLSRELISFLDDHPTLDYNVN